MARCAIGFPRAGGERRTPAFTAGMPIGGAGRARLDARALSQAVAAHGGAAYGGADRESNRSTLRRRDGRDDGGAATRSCWSTPILARNPTKILEVMLGVPANANSNQRFLTEEAAQAAGFTVLGVVNEPSAAAIEFGYRSSAERKNKPGTGLLVYDLGGGTFDVSLVTLARRRTHRRGVGWDSRTLVAMILTRFLPNIAVVSMLGRSPAHSLRSSGRMLLEECREKKEIAESQYAQGHDRFRAGAPGLEAGDDSA